MEMGKKIIFKGKEIQITGQHFNIFFVTKETHPKFGPDIFNDFLIVNFTATTEAIAAHLLTQIVKIIEPTTQQQREENIVNLLNYKRHNKQSQNLILNVLSRAKSETIVDNDDYVCILNETRRNVPLFIAKIEECTEKESKFQ